MVNQSTQQWMYKAAILTICLILGGIFAFLFVAAIRFGDGEAVRIIDAVQPLALQILGALATIVLGSHAATAYVAKQQAAVNIAAGSAAPVTVTASSATPPTEAASQPASGV